MSKTLTNLKSLTKFYATGSSTDTSFNDTDILISLNGRYQESLLLATSVDGDFEFNGDGSQSINITAGVRAYTLATDLFKPQRVEIKYPSSATNYVEATQINASSMNTGKDSYTASPPQFDLMGTKLEIFVSAQTANIEAITAGVKVYYQKELTELVDGANVIIFPDVFARYIAIGAAQDFCGVNGLNGRLSWLENEHQKQEQKLTEYVASRNKAKKLSINFRQEDYGVGDSGYGVSDVQI